MSCNGATVKAFFSSLCNERASGALIRDWVPKERLRLDKSLSWWANRD
jgi:hypothetical protein